ncbi:C4-type zinc ribbon domain-containing protein [Proteiniborus sp. MB09-C3]|uniref:zinc ribbon domain-containing protein n=1 Tax=Proteiniborus sp. MB09-C3 TaxID=3050072 RepID=UPI0025541D47|nr:C4-type zinc ribbon domain-containing protein [Proteiniborus sp. MB09-C3]WIV10713.1 C4-type zinc ribbon domain-containing protein [Proteiniborus sp. MB09-C3]
MSQLKLLWSMQQHDRRLAQLIQKLKEIENEKKMDDLIVKLRQVEYDVTNKKTRKEVNELKIQRSNSKLEQILFKLNDIEGKLYDGSISDLKQLTYMNKEAQDTKKEFIKLEKEILILMEETEKLGQELMEVVDIYNKLKEEKDNNMKECESVSSQIKLEIKKEKIIISKISSRLSEDLRKKYTTLKASKGKVLAQVYDGKCNGCHMTIPLFIMSKLKNKDEITYCDNCGRILYYKES